MNAQIDEMNKDFKYLFKFGIPRLECDTLPLKPLLEDSEMTEHQRELCDDDAIKTYLKMLGTVVWVVSNIQPILKFAHHCDGTEIRTGQQCAHNTILFVTVSLFFNV